MDEKKNLDLYKKRLKDVNDLINIISTYTSRGLSEEELLKVSRSFKVYRDFIYNNFNILIFLNNLFFGLSIYQAKDFYNMMINGNFISQTDVDKNILYLVGTSVINGVMAEKYFDSRSLIKDDLKIINDFKRRKRTKRNDEILLLKRYEEELSNIKTEIKILDSKINKKKDLVKK